MILTPVMGISNDEMVKVEGAQYLLLISIMVMEIKVAGTQVLHVRNTC